MSHIKISFIYASIQLTYIYFTIYYSFALKIYIYVCIQSRERKMSKQILAMFLLIYTTPFSLDSKMSSKILIKTAVFGTRPCRCNIFSI